MDRIDASEKGRLGKAFQRLRREWKRTSQKERTRQYEACFGHTAQGPVPAYELEYGEEHTHRQPQQLGDIAAFYRAFGLKISENGRERVDHASVECEFMSYLLMKEGYALQHDGKEKAGICREASRRFLSEHPGRWLPGFAMRLARVARRGLLREIADFVLMFVVQDCRGLGIPPEPEDLPVRPVQENEDLGCVNCSLKPGFQK